MKSKFLFLNDHQFEATLSKQFGTYFTSRYFPYKHAFISLKVFIVLEVFILLIKAAHMYLCIDLDRCLYPLYLSSIIYYYFTFVNSTNIYGLMTCTFKFPIIVRRFAQKSPRNQSLSWSKCWEWLL